MKKLLYPIVGFVLTGFLCLAARGATVFSEDFEAYTVTAGIYVNRTTLTNWTISRGTVDVVDGAHALAPVGNGTKFLDMIGVNGFSDFSFSFTNLTPATVYTLRFRAATPNGVTTRPCELLLTDFNNALLNVAVARTNILAYQGLVTTGTFPTNLTATLTPSDAIWATNRWVTNSISWTSPSTNAVVRFIIYGLNPDHAGIFLDDILVTGP